MKKEKKEKEFFTFLLNIKYFIINLINNLKNNFVILSLIYFYFYLFF